MKDWKDIPGDSREKYKFYMCSREWNEKVRDVRKRSKNICERCKINPGGQTHHLTYIRLYNEKLDDLQDWCDGCHKFVSGKSDFDPLTTKKKEKNEVLTMDRAERVSKTMDSNLGQNIREDIKKIIRDDCGGNRGKFKFSDYFFELLERFPNLFERQDQTALNKLLNKDGTLTEKRKRKRDQRTVLAVSMPTVVESKVDDLKAKVNYLREMDAHPPRSYSAEEVRVLLKLKEDGII